VIEYEKNSTGGADWSNPLEIASADMKWRCPNGFLIIKEIQGEA
jgi:hypothetical protein